MPSFDSHDGVRISYDVEGEGAVVVLFHGFASDSYINWIRPGLVDALTGAGFRAVTMDHRGHGSSGAPEDAASYRNGAMVRDAGSLLDHLEVERAHVVGFSMGAFVGLALTARDDRVASLVCGGVGTNVTSPPDPGRHEVIAEALLAEDKRTITDPMARGFRDFAELTGADREALAAIQRAHVTEHTSEDLDAVKVPVLVVCGDRDDIAGDPQDLARALADARVVIVGGTHLNVVNNPEFHQAVTDFLRGVEKGTTDG